MRFSGHSSHVTSPNTHRAAQVELGVLLFSYIQFLQDEQTSTVAEDTPMVKLARCYSKEENLSITGLRLPIFLNSVENCLNCLFVLCSALVENARLSH